MIYDILPTKVYVKQAEKFDAIQKEVETAIAKSEFGYQPEWGKTVKLSNFKDWSNCIIDRCEMTSLKEEIYNSVCDYAQRELRYVCNSWIAKYFNFINFTYYIEFANISKNPLF